MSDDLASLPTSAYLAALLSLDGVGPARLRALLEGRVPEAAWQGIRGRAPWVTQAVGSARLAAQWAQASASVDPAGMRAVLRRLGLGIVDAASPAYPEPLRDDPEPPGVLFVDGDLRAIGERRVAIVGTRRCTRYGHDIAAELGYVLAAAGVTVVSGLALGIDAAAHRGALAGGHAPPVAVVASGLDRPYPRQNQALWREVAAAGAVLSEAPVGVHPEPWRFPSRNRVIAGLAEIVVVVESHERGGSLYTVSEALRRDRPVVAVPGPIRSAASAGTNALLADGCHVLTRIDDVLALLDLVGDTARPRSNGDERLLRQDPGDQTILDSLGWQPTTIDEVIAETGEAIDVVAQRLGHLERNGRIARRGRWYERCVELPGAAPRGST